MLEIPSACRGYFYQFGAKFDIFCEPRATECACASSEAIPVRVYMRKDSLTKPIYQLVHVTCQQSKITSNYLILFVIVMSALTSLCAMLLIALIKNIDLLSCTSV